MTSERMIMVPEWLIEEAASLIEQAGLVGIGVSMAAPRLRAALDQPAAGEPVAPKEVGEVIVTLRDGMKCFAFEEYSEAYKLPEGLHYLYPAPPAAAHGDSASEQHRNNMADTIVSLRTEIAALRRNAAAHEGEAVLTFEYVGPRDERRTVEVTREEVADHLDYMLFEKLTAAVCGCDPAESDDCRCDEYAEQFTMRAQAGEGGEV